MPAVTPAEVQTGPSRTKIGSGSTRTAGKRRASSAQHDQWVAARRPSSTTRSRQQERPGADGGDATRLPRARPHPLDQHRIRGRRLDARAAGDHQRIHGRVDGRQRVRVEPKPGRGGHADAAPVALRVALRHDPQRVGRHSARFGNQIVGGREHLKRPRDVEHLHRREDEHFDDASDIWRERGDFGISARACPCRLVLSIPNLRPGDAHDPA